ncbi:putative pectate lyase 8 [Rosa sericea]
MVVSESNRYCLYACMSLLLVFGFVANCSSSAVDDPEQIGSMVDMRIRNNGTERETMRKQQASCRTGNPIDDCWRCDPNWFNNRKRLADCAIGFGKNAKGGRDGRFYVVSDSSDNDAVNPRPGTLRHAVIQIEPLWIVFARDMLITLKQELIMNSFKTIDGRGVNVQIAYGAGITIQYVTNIIIHGVHIHHCKPTGNAMVRSSPSHFGRRGMADGDAISIFGSKNIWIDHNSLSNCYDGLVDVVEASTAVTVSNNLFTDHDKVMLLGHNDAYTQDKVMQVTVAYNRFGQGLGQRMPHCRHGSFHVLNNDYPNGWGVYAIGGAANPTINSQGNRFYADAVKHPYTNQVTKRISGSESEWKRWNWRSSGDVFLNSAYFVQSGDASRAAYVKASSTLPKPASMVEAITADAGVLTCRRDHVC